MDGQTQRAPTGFLFGTASLCLLVLALGQDEVVARVVLFAVAVVSAAVAALCARRSA